MGKINSKQKGNRYERQICTELREMGYQAERSSYVNKQLDDIGKVDIETDFPFNIQCKSMANQPNIDKTLMEINTDKPPVIFFKKNRCEEVVIMKKSDFYKLWISTKL